ncbi:hypothetical protein SULPSESMR1_03421 [Pseudosulfitobacter pseudonitzschiae]|uniref:Cthe-2314-like HEPN domain-containing protein n=1 Tax=Pseudosulfitobacter pseudonitzschiae TaxID=1402135 RepID=A0A221K5Q3_9RHOB|nr:hypothetical protein SULPSESMR1_03421 [Pseudosulfitobacter pseudonitzschiae]
MSLTQLEFHEYELDWGELSTLPADHLAAFSVLSFAVSEVNVLRKNYISISHDYTGEKSIDSANNINKFLVLRTWSSKLFEIAEFLRKIHKKKETSDARLFDFAKTASGKFDKLDLGDGHNIARYIRNEASHHYSFSSAKENIKHVFHGGDFNFYTHDVGGNDFYPLGEEVMFYGRLNRKWANIPSKTARNKLLQEWFDFNIKVTDWLMKTHGYFAREFIFVALGRNMMVVKSYDVPSALVGDLSKTLTPIFYVKDAK